MVSIVNARLVHCNDDFNGIKISITRNTNIYIYIYI
jgi:hypothetical protein